jgi:hypothetical protein
MQSKSTDLKLFCALSLCIPTYCIV